MEVMKRLNVVGVCLANNHMMDFGKAGLERTLKLLDDQGIAHAGAGMNLEQAMEPMVIGSGQEAVLVQNFGWDVEETVYAASNKPGCAPRKKSLILERTKKLRLENPESKILTVLHWGFELQPVPMPVDVALAHEMASLGTDLIIGHHPHIIQPYEFYENTPIYYSLGNFYFSDLRTNLSHKTFQWEVADLGNYGAMVVYDTKTGQTDHENLIYYDRKADESRRMANENRVLKDYTGTDFFSLAYAEEAESLSMGKKTVLTLDQPANRRKLRKLFFRYRLSAIGLTVRKFALGRWLDRVRKRFLGKK
jgi:hypothetical protein